MKTRHPFRNIVLPLLLLIPLIDIMVGCIYIPTWTNPVLSGTKTDFRGWAADHEHNAPWDLADIHRGEVETMFGKPPFASKNGRVAVYVMGTEDGIIIWPLCFGGGFANGKTHVLKLVYGDDGSLKRFQWLQDWRDPAQYWFGHLANAGPGYREVMQLADPDPMYAAQIILDKLNDYCPPDERIDVGLQVTGHTTAPSTAAWPATAPSRRPYD